MSTEHPSAALPRLIADIGGTNIRLAWIPRAGEAARDQRVLPCADFPDVEAAVRHYLQDTGAPAPRLAALGIANPVTGDQVRMTNHTWQFSQRALQQALGLQRLVVINDFTALALSLPLLDASLLRQVGGGAADPHSAVALIGAGTGLGVSGLVYPPGSTQAAALAGEGGHVTLPTESVLEFQVMEQLQRRYGHVSAERVLSGQGLVDLYHALRTLRGEGGADVMHAAEVTTRGLDGSDAVAVQVLEMFCGWLGSVAGNLVLTLGARGGVYIGGGIVPRLGEWFDRSPFRSRFEAKGRFRGYLEPIPCWVIDAQANPALLGLARVLEHG